MTRLQVRRLWDFMQVQVSNKLSTYVDISFFRQQQSIKKFPIRIASQYSHMCAFKSLPLKYVELHVLGVTIHS